MKRNIRKHRITPIKVVGCILFISIILGCQSQGSTISLLQNSISEYHARGGAYLLMDMETEKIIDKQAINYNLGQTYQTDFKQIGLNELLSPEEILAEYVAKVKNNKNLRHILRQNVLSGVAKKVNIHDIEIYGAVATTNKGNDKSVITTFLGHYKMNNNYYAIIVVLDDPQPLRETYGFRSAGWNVVNLAKRLISTLTTELR